MHRMQRAQCRSAAGGHDCLSGDEPPEQGTLAVPRIPKKEVAIETLEIQVSQQTGERRVVIVHGARDCSGSRASSEALRCYMRDNLIVFTRYTSRDTRDGPFA